jgi:hypothetical protein
MQGRNLLMSGFFQPKPPDWYQQAVFFYDLRFPPTKISHG